MHSRTWFMTCAAKVGAGLTGFTGAFEEFLRREGAMLKTIPCLQASVGSGFDQGTDEKIASSPRNGSNMLLGKPGRFLRAGPPRVVANETVNRRKKWSVVE